MPLYEFVCTECAARTDIFASLAEKEAGLDVPCATCGSHATRRALSSISVRGRASSAALSQAGAATRRAEGGGCGGGCACG
jgi:putative FmdB family regulatory protein